MSVAKHDPLTELRRAIRQSGRQYRRADDNSRSLFNPNAGFVWAYDIPEVERALDAYEAKLPPEQQTQQNHLSAEAQLIKEAQLIQGTHDDMQIRDFARTVIAYLLIDRHGGEIKSPLAPVKGAPVINLVDRLDNDAAE